MESRATAPEKCPDAKRGVKFYRSRYILHREKMGAAEQSRSADLTARCPQVHWLARIWKSRAYVAREASEAVLILRKRMRWDVSLAINTVFGEYAPQAHRVVSCESGHSPRASNGQYLGLFQMGSYARSAFGHGPDPLTQARAAYRYFVASGRDWSPWSCKP